MYNNIINPVTGESVVTGSIEGSAILNGFLYETMNGGNPPSDSSGPVVKCSATNGTTGEKLNNIKSGFKKVSKLYKNMILNPYVHKMLPALINIAYKVTGTVTGNKKAAYIEGNIIKKRAAGKYKYCNHLKKYYNNLNLEEIEGIIVELKQAEEQQGGEIAELEDYVDHDIVELTKIINDVKHIYETQLDGLTEETRYGIRGFVRDTIISLGSNYKDHNGGGLRERILEGEAQIMGMLPGPIAEAGRSTLKTMAAVDKRISELRDDPRTVPALVVSAGELSRRSIGAGNEITYRAGKALAIANNKLAELKKKLSGNTDDSIITSTFLPLLKWSAELPSNVLNNFIKSGEQSLKVLNSCDTSMERACILINRIIDKHGCAASGDEGSEESESKPDGCTRIAEIFKKTPSIGDDYEDEDQLKELGGILKKGAASIDNTMGSLTGVNMETIKSKISGLTNPFGLDDADQQRLKETLEGKSLYSIILDNSNGEQNQVIKNYMNLLEQIMNKKIEAINNGDNGDNAIKNKLIATVGSIVNFLSTASPKPEPRTSGKGVAAREGRSPTIEGDAEQEESKVDEEGPPKKEAPKEPVERTAKQEAAVIAAVETAINKEVGAMAAVEEALNKEFTEIAAVEIAAVEIAAVEKAAKKEDMMAIERVVENAEGGDGEDISVSAIGGGGDRGPPYNTPAEAARKNELPGDLELYSQMGELVIIHGLTGEHSGLNGRNYTVCCRQDREGDNRYGLYDYPAWYSAGKDKYILESGPNKYIQFNSAHRWHEEHIQDWIDHNGHQTGQIVSKMDDNYIIRYDAVFPRAGTSRSNIPELVVDPKHPPSHYLDIENVKSDTKFQFITKENCKKLQKQINIFDGKDGEDARSEAWNRGLYNGEGAKDLWLMGNGLRGKPRVAIDWELMEKMSNNESKLDFANGNIGMVVNVPIDPRRLDSNRGGSEWKNGTNILYNIPEKNIKVLSMVQKKIHSFMTGLRFILGSGFGTGVDIQGYLDKFRGMLAKLTSKKPEGDGDGE